METIESEHVPNQDFQDMLDFLGDKKFYSESIDAGPFGQSLHISKQDDTTVIVEYLEPGNYHHIFFVTPTETKAVKKYSDFSQGTRTENLEPDKTLDEVLKRFGIK